jgi:type IV pilus assembly protein PilN
MVQINLLPVREARRRADLRQQVVQLVLVLMLVSVGVGFVHSRISGQVEQSRLRVQQMEADIKQFKPQLDQVAAFRKKKASLEKKIGIIDGLDRARRGPVQVLDELATHTPERLWLSSLKTTGKNVKLVGESLDNELVAVFLRALGDSAYFGQVDLESTELGKPADGLKVVRFRIDAVLQSPKKGKQAAQPPPAAPPQAQAQG